MARKKDNKITKPLPLEITTTWGIQNNDYVQQGFRGIPKILSTDAYDSFYRHMGAKQQLSGGRFRPLSVVTFAIEQQLFGSNAEVKPPDDAAFVRHFMNVVYYLLSIVLLLYFLKNYIFKEEPLIAFVACLIFLIHPMHTEVVANVKSRDEILSFLFIILTFISIFRYRESKNAKQLLFGLLFYFLALLSKEYAITLLVLIPMLLYIVLKESLSSILQLMIPFAIVAALYVGIRFSIVGAGAKFENPDVLNNPYIYATHQEKLATKIEVLLRYLKMLFYPSPLSSDYSYSTIPFVNFSNGIVWASILIHTSMFVAAIILFFKRNILSFAIAFYFVHLLLISNLIFNVGATMGERMVYHSSFGFAIVLAVFISRILQKFFSAQTKKIVAVSFGCLVVIWCGAKTIKRNTEWKNDQTLFIADAKTVPNSALVNGNAGKAFIDMSEKPENKARELELINKGIFYLNRSVNVHNKYVNGYLNLGVAYFKLKDYEKAKAFWGKAKEIYPSNPLIKRNFDLLGATYFNQGMSIGGKNIPEAIKLMEKAVSIDSTKAEYWYNIGGASFTIKDYKKARIAWEKTLELKPDYQQAQEGIKALPPQ
ncbi:MAG: tetratricopeptide repeat protein [Bacteroidetes bacterium]|nr:tetratricopeptide repeat protein [Bacteroidota bacterium]